MVDEVVFVVPFEHRFDSDIGSADDADDGFAFAVVMLIDDSFADDAGVIGTT